MSEEASKPRAAPGKIVARDEVIAACLAVLVREFQTAGVTLSAALKVLRDAPDRIDAALTRGPGALILYRIDATAPAGMISDNDTRLNRFVTDAELEGAGVIGLNPFLIACLAAEAEGFAVIKREWVNHAAQTLH